MKNRNIISKLAALLLCVAMVLSLTACGKATPEKIVSGKVEELCKAITSGDLTKLAQLTGDESADLGDLDELPGIQALFEEIMSTVKYKMGDAVVDGDTAEVPVHFSYTDQSEVFTIAFKNYFSKILELAFAAAFSEDVQEPSDEEMAELLTEYLQEAKKEVKESKTSEKDITFKLNKNSEGDWNFISVPEALADVVTGNIISALENLDLGF